MAFFMAYAYCKPDFAFGREWLFVFILTVFSTKCPLPLPAVSLHGNPLIVCTCQQCTCTVHLSVLQGRNCEIDTNSCRSSPCLNGGTCSNLDNDYTCRCPQGFTGDSCADVDDCTPGACSFGMCVVSI